MSAITSRLVHLAITFGTLLTESISDCENTLVNGVATTPCGAATPAINAYWRNLKEPSLLIPRVDLYSPFVQMHPLGWNVNRRVLVDHFGYDVVTAPSSLMSNTDLSNIEQLQSSSVTMLLTNVVLPPTNSWHPYVHSVHFDEDTRLAVMILVPDSTTATTDPNAAALATLDYIAKRSDEDGVQWIPVIYYGYPDAPIETLLEEMVSHRHPPSLVLEVAGNHAPSLEKPILINGTTWICSYNQNDDFLHRFEVELSDATDISSDGSFFTTTTVTDVTFVAENLTQIPHQDDQYQADVQFLQELAAEAFDNNPVAGFSGAMPATRDDDIDLRLCFGGECPLGNLFTDALRWKTGADIAFMTSGGMRGPGWNSGPVTVLDLWSALPFGNHLCTGSIMGLHLLQLLNHSTAVATYQSTYHPDGDELLQVSGMRYTYNTQLSITESSSSRLIGVDIFDDATGTYSPVERTKIYTFATDSYVCGHGTWKPMVVTDLILKGEVPGTTQTDDVTHQGVVQEYLSGLWWPYNTSIIGRLMNDTSALEALDFLQTKELCSDQSGSTWSEGTQTCVTCPNQGEKVRFSEPSLSFQLELGSTQLQAQETVELINLESFPVKVTPKVIPPWMELTDRNETRLLESGEGMNMTITVASSSSLGVGTASGTLSLGVVDGGNYPGCTGGDVVLDVMVQTLPSNNLNQLGDLRYVGFTLCAIAALTALGFGIWVYHHRTNRVVRTMQPPFLVKTCFGIVIIASALAPISIDDEIVPADQVSIACMATPWLIGLGTAVAFSAIFSKLWRINRLFHAEFRRVQVTEKDVFWPFWLLLSANIVFLLSWTFADPLEWERKSISGQPWNTYGQCSGDGAVSSAMLGCVIIVALVGLGMACWQAWRARSISTEFSEAKYIGIAVFCWLQLGCVAGPVFFLINKEDTTTLYFVVVAVVFIICMTMLGFIFVPLVLHQRADAKKVRSRKHIQVAGIDLAVNHSQEDVMERARTCIEGTVTRTPPGDVEGNDTQALKEELAALQESVSQLEREKEVLGTENEKLRNNGDMMPSRGLASLDNSLELEDLVFKSSDDDSSFD